MMAFLAAATGIPSLSVGVVDQNRLRVAFLVANGILEALDALSRDLQDAQCVDLDGDARDAYYNVVRVRDRLRCRLERGHE